MNEKDLSKIGFGETGPLLVHEAIQTLNLNQYLGAYDLFCPISWRDTERIVYPSEKVTLPRLIKIAKDMVRPMIYPATQPGRITPNSYAVHLWNEIWTQNKLDKNAVYDKNCLYERLKRKYL